MNTSTQSNPITRSIPWVDRFAVGVSALCVLHCLFTPLLLLAVPSLVDSTLGTETFHTWLVIAIIPSSLFALGLGCKQHGRGLFLFIGVSGLSFLVLAIFVESLAVDHVFEQVFTVIGAVLIAAAHVRNFQLCRKLAGCGGK